MTVHIPVQSVSDDLAASIKQIDTAMKSIVASGIKRETLVILLKAKLGNRIAVQDIRNVLDSMDGLAATYLERKR